MRRFIPILIILSIVFFSGCSTTGKNIDSGKAYLACKVAGFDHKMEFRNLDTNKKITVKFKDSEYTTLAAIPPGRYAILSISGMVIGLMATTDITIAPPDVYYQILTVQEGTVLYLGNYLYDMNKISFLGYADVNDLFVDFDLDKAYQDIVANYAGVEGLEYITPMDLLNK